MVAVCAPVVAHAAEGSWVQRLLSFESASAGTISGANAFQLNGVELETSCLIREEQFTPLFKPLIGKQVTDLEILNLMREMRSALAKQGFRSIKTSYPASRVKNGVVVLSVNADIPPAMADVAKTQCQNQPVLVSGAPATTRVVKHISIGGMTEVDPAPYAQAAAEMQGKAFNSLDVIHLMQDIRKAYRDAKQPLPYISFDSALAKQGTIQLTVVEKKRKGAPKYISPEDIPIKVARPIPTPLIATSDKPKPLQAPPPVSVAKGEAPTPKTTLIPTPGERLAVDGLQLLDTPENRKAIAEAQQPKAAPQAKVAPKVVPKPFTKEDVQDERVGVATPKEPTKVIRPSAVVPTLPPLDVAPSTGETELTPVPETTVASAPINPDVEIIDSQEITYLDASTPENLSYRERSENELLILRTFIEGEPRDEALLAYSTRESKQLLLSLTGFVNALGVPIEVSPEQGMATGWYLSEDNRFQMVYPFDRAFIGGKIFKIKPGAAELHYDDIYVSANALMAMFDVDIELNFSALQLFISPSTKLPFQQQKERYKMWQQLTNAKERMAARPKPPKRELPYTFASKPTLRVDSRTSYQNSEAAGSSLTQNISAISQGDLLGFSNQSVLSIIKRQSDPYEIDSFEMLFRKQDDSGELLGPLQATNIQWGDITMRAIPLIEGTRKGRGIEVSNEPVSYVRDPDNLTIEGFAPPTWDVEIFQDERLIDFLTVDNSGRYEFTAIPLRSGLNVFRILAHGPNGELRETVRRYFLGAGQVKEGEFLYQLSALEGTKPLIGIGNNADRVDQGSAYQTSFIYGLSQGFSLAGGLYDGEINTLNTQAASAGFRASLWEAYIQADAMLEAEGGSIYNITARRNLTNTMQLLVGAETSSGFSGTVRPDKNNHFIRLDNSIQLGQLHPIGYSLEYRKETFNNGQSPVTRWQNRLNTFVKRFNISNELELEQRENTPDLLQGNFLIRRNARGGFWRGQLTYSDDVDGFTFDSANLRGQFNLGRNVTYIGEVNQTLSNEKVTRLNNRLTWEWKALRLGLETQLTDNGDYTVGLNVGTTLAPKEMGYEPLARQSAASEGVVLVRVFLDKNEDRIYQPDEDVLEGVTVKNRSRGGQAVTNSGGVASLARMAVFQPNHVLLDGTTLPDFYMQPADDLVSVIARPGIIGTIDLAVYQLGEIAGTVTLKRGDETSILEGAPIALYDMDDKKIGSLKSEYDGFFVFPSLRMGQYKLKIPASYLEKYGITEPIETLVSLEAGMSIVDDIELVIDERQNG